ncbi:MAG: hypothetical protein ABFC62_08995 [Clostridiaceae bacterium]|nr:hypothetical protein [Eubacteriales bacterium]
MQRRRLKAKNKRKTAVRLAFLALGALALIGAVTGLVLALSKGAALGAMEALPFSAEATQIFTGNGFLYLADGKLNYFDLNDERKNLSLSTSTTDVRLAASKGIYALYNSSAVQIVGVSFPIEFSGTVQSVRCGSAYVAVYRLDASGNGAIQVFNFKGERQAESDVDLSGATLVNYGFRSGDDDTLWTLTLDTGSSTPVQTLTTYDLAKTATTGVITVSGELAETVAFTEKSVFAVCTGNLLRFNRTGNAQAYRVIVYGYKYLDASFAGPRPLFLFVPRDGAKLSSVMLLSVDEADVASERRVFLQLPPNALTAAVANGKLLVYCADAVYVYSEKGTLLSKEAFETPIDAAAKLDDSHMVVTRGGTLYLAPVS